MINYIWVFILIFGFAYGLFFGGGEVLTRAVTVSSQKTVELVIGLCGILCLWNGVMKIAEKSGITEKIALLLNPILKLLFKNYANNEKVLGNIVMNITANMMGISNAATPFGIKAMEEMQKDNINKDKATNDMALFLVINASCIQLVPTTILSIRSICNSNNPGEIIIPSIITTGLSGIVGIIICKILQKYF